MDARTGRIRSGAQPWTVGGTQVASRSRGGPHWACWVLAGTLALAGGCQNSSGGLFARKDKGISRLSPRSVPYLTGVPVPSGFQISDRSTDAKESGGVRFARHEYLGHAEPPSIREFYKEQMPLLGWREISSHDFKGRLSMRFENNHEECNLTIEPAGWFNRSSIQVVVSPFKRSASEPPAKRPMP